VQWSWRSLQVGGFHRVSESELNMRWWFHQVQGLWGLLPGWHPASLSLLMRGADCKILRQ
jgi:hypothetical protein